MTRILVVEDNPANMKLAVMLLERAGYQVAQADNAVDGMALARSLRPDLILMDIQLPGMDGLSATGELKQDEATRGIIGKPIQYREFLARVARTLAERSIDQDGGSRDE